MDWSICTIPSFFPVWMMEGIWYVLPSRIRLDTAAVPTMISCAATRPAPPFLRSSCCATTPRRLSESIARTWCCRSPGKVSMMRSTVLCALLVCSVPNTRCPVSAAVSARAMVSRSRISPTRITSGSSRSAALSAVAKLSVCGPTSRWFTSAFLLRVDELDGILDGEDVLRPRLVDQVDHGRERRRLARSRGARHQHQPLVEVRELADHVGEPDLLRGGDLGGDDAEHRPRPPVLAEEVAAKARRPRDLVGKVQVVRGAVPLQLRRA